MGLIADLVRMLFNRPVDPVEGRGLFRPQGADFECSDGLDDEENCGRAVRDNDVDPERPVRRETERRPRPIEPVEGRGLFRPVAGDFEGGHGLEGPDLPDRDRDPESPPGRRRRNGGEPILD